MSERKWVCDLPGVPINVRAPLAALEARLELLEARIVTLEAETARIRRIPGHAPYDDGHTHISSVPGGSRCAGCSARWEWGEGRWVEP